ncbi:unnamed protein product [Absidia cylindrospora]
MVLNFTVVSLLLLTVVKAENGISTPPMGWNTWNRYGCQINEQLIKNSADMIVSQGYRNAGYTYLNLDDCWQSHERNSDGDIVIDSAAFPNGLRTLADYVHSRGLKFGIYSSAGRQTCAGRMASSGYEIQDAFAYATMGVDYLKYDNCNYDEGISAKTRYEAMARAINATGRNMFFSVCNWGTENTWEWASNYGHKYGHSFRTHDDIYNDWKSIVEILNVHATVVSRSGKGRWADPDMLEIGNGKLTVDESRTHFSIWAAMKSPLILGNNLTSMPKELFNIVTNKNVIQVNQDALGLPAKRILHIPHDKDIWAGELTNHSIILVAINYMDQKQSLSIDVNKYGYSGSDIVVFDLWGNVTVALENTRYIHNITINPHGVFMAKLTNGTIDQHFSDSLESHNMEDDHSSAISTTNQNYYQSKSIKRYEAEKLDNMVYGLARRRGCLSCSGGAQVIALGKVNSPQTGTLQFRNIKLDQTGEYRLTIGYLDCFSWTTCGDYWTRRWGLRISLENHDQHHWVNRLTVALKSLGQMETSRRFTLGLTVMKEEALDITFDNPDGYGPSIDYIEIQRVGELTDDGHKNTYLYTLPIWQTDDLLASESATLARWIVDYFWEWLAVVASIGFTGGGFWLGYVKYTNRRNKYSILDSSNMNIANC